MVEWITDETRNSQENPCPVQLPSIQSPHAMTVCIKWKLEARGDINTPT